MTKKQNTTGLFRVSKVKNYNSKKPYRFAYQMKTECFHCDIRAIDILKLKERVTQAGLPWGIVNKDLAIITANEEGINPMDLNSNLDSKYVKIHNNFTFEELGHCTGCNFCFTTGRNDCVYQIEVVSNE